MNIEPKRLKGEKFMSRFSGRYDLFDAMSGTGGWFDKNGNPVKFNQEGVSCYYSDVMKDFEAFKNETDGVIHQHIKVKVDEWNQDYVKTHCKGFNFEKHIKTIIDKRCNSGIREIQYYTYNYYNKEYKDLKELNKHGVFITKDIHFNTLLDLVPYFPYIVTVAAHSDGKSYIVVSKESFVEEEFKEHLRDSADTMANHYRHELAKFTQKVVLRYFSDYKERTIEQDFKIEKENDKYIVHLEKPLDYNFDIKLVTSEPYWSNPKQIDDYTLDVTDTFFDIEKRETIRIKYVHKKDYELWLD